MPRFDVVGLGVASCDYVTRLERLPGLDEKVRSQELLVEGGGTVGNALVTVARLGLRAAFAGTVGDDEFGRFILAGLEKEGVDTLFAREAAGTRSPFSFCVSIPPARNVFSVAPTTPPFDLGRVDLGALLDARFLHLDGSDEEAAVALASEARRRGVEVSLDLQRVRRTSDALLRHADVAVVSEGFARERFGPKPPEESVRELFLPGMRLAAVTLGARGSVATEGGEPYAVPAEAVEVVDTTGAGDVYHGALLVALLSGHRVPDALGFATHVAGLSCRELGGRAGIPTRDEVADRL